ncbi:uncharacterized protein LOC129242233 [Anastrepha obliqua]|uniref:uncharacterized protein LOC129242233 n=1 Tax=Anastrepha obliqua TaxID=95512 RepID=UPI00240A0707|nr:uncharacterized protein LOC129242233 [Anastrepha obliqua]
MRQISRTLSALTSPLPDCSTSKTMISNSKQGAASAATNNRHQRCRAPSRLSAVTCQYFNFHFASLTMSSYLILLLLSLGAQRDALVHAQNSTTAVGAAATAPPPHAAALASPGAGTGSGSGSSILDQFSPNCTAVSHIFQARGIDQAEIPQKPSNDSEKADNASQPTNQPAGPNKSRVVR